MFSSLNFGHSAFRKKKAGSHSYRPSFESLEKMVLLSITPIDTHVVVTTSATVTASNGPDTQFESDTNDYPNTLPPTISYSPAVSVSSTYDVPQQASAAASLNAIASSGTNGTQSGQVTMSGNVSVSKGNSPPTIIVDGFVISQWTYTFQSSSSVVINISDASSLQVVGFADQPPGSLVDIGVVAIKNVGNNSTVVSDQIFVYNGTTSPVISINQALPPGQYAIALEIPQSPGEFGYGGGNGAVSIQATFNSVMNWSVGPVSLQDVTFGGSGFYPISSDPTPSGSVTVYGSDQWDPSEGHQYPVLYAGGSTPTVNVTFQLPSSQSEPTVEARGYGPDAFNIPATNVTQSGNELLLSNANMSQAFDSQVQYYQEFSIDWQLSFDGGNTWVDVGTSDNPMYVTAAAPTPDPASGYLFLTVVNSAVMNTQGLSSSANAQIISQTWGIFTSLNVTDYAGNALSYYANINSQNTTVASLLQYDDGQCGAWTGLFLDMLLVNGINPACDYVIVTAGTPGESGFLVDNWNFPTSGTSHNPIYPYVNYNASGQYPLFNNNQYVWTYADVTDAPGIPGQNSANPASLFGNHQIAEINGTYYDPSYGVTYNNLLQMDSQSIAGFFTFGEYYAAPLHKFVKAMFIRQNTNPKVGDLVGFNQNWASQSDVTLGITTIQRPIAIGTVSANNTIPLASISLGEGVITPSTISDWGSSTVRIPSTITAKRTVTPVRQPFLGTPPSRTMGSIRPAQKTKPFLYGEA